MAATCRPGDLIGSGTVSGIRERRARLPAGADMARDASRMQLPSGETRKFLEDGDEVIFRGYAEREGYAASGLANVADIDGYDWRRACRA